MKRRVIHASLIESPWVVEKDSFQLAYSLNLDTKEIIINKLIKNAKKYENNHSKIVGNILKLFLTF